jgi:hypothetical protein
MITKATTITKNDMLIFVIFVRFVIIVAGPWPVTVRYL